MQMIGVNDTDVLLDEMGQPVSAGDGEAVLVADDSCWLQDLKNEALTEEGELFYENESGNDRYGWGLLDFLQGEADEFFLLEIQQRIRSKMTKRSYIDAASIKISIDYNGHQCHIRITFKRNDSSTEYNMDIQSDGVEVIVE